MATSDQIDAAARTRRSSPGSATRGSRHLLHMDLTDADQQIIAAEQAAATRLVRRMVADPADQARVLAALGLEEEQ